MTHVLKTDLGSHGPPNPCDPADQEDVCKCKCMCIQSLADQSYESLTRTCWTSCGSLFFLFCSARARVSPQERRRWRGSPLPLRYLIIRKYTHALFVSFFLSHMQACARAQTHTHTHTHTHTRRSRAWGVRCRRKGRSWVPAILLPSRPFARAGLSLCQCSCRRRLRRERGRFQFNLLSTNKTICFRKQQQKPMQLPPPSQTWAWEEEEQCRLRVGCIWWT